MEAQTNLNHTLHHVMHYKEKSIKNDKTDVHLW